MKKIILASNSPRRKEILKKIGLKFKVVKSNFEEYVDPKLKPHTLVKKLSLEKAKAIYKNYKNAIVIGADTIVVCKGKILGKPKNEKEAFDMLKLLSGRTHWVLTGLTIIDTAPKKIITKAFKTRVKMRKIKEEEIDSYIRTKEPFDKAGSYAIQGVASKFIEKIVGDRESAIGLPLKPLTKELKKLGVKML